MYYGLHFISDAKIPVQVRVDSASLRIWCRAAPNGEWGAWRRMDVDRKADGTLAEVVAESSHAKLADAAGRLRSPMRIDFVGGNVTGTVEFDGSQSAKCALSANVTGGIESEIKGAIKVAIEEHEQRYHSQSTSY